MHSIRDHAAEGTCTRALVSASEIGAPTPSVTSQALQASMQSDMQPYQSVAQPTQCSPAYSTNKITLPRIFDKKITLQIPKGTLYLTCRITAFSLSVRVYNASNTWRPCTTRKICHCPNTLYLSPLSLTHSLTRPTPTHSYLFYLSAFSPYLPVHT